VFYAKFCSPTRRVGTFTAYGDYGLLGCDALYTDRFRYLLSIWQQVPPKRWYLSIITSRDIASHTPVILIHIVPSETQI
jgi:hypothetical protein